MARIPARELSFERTFRRRRAFSTWQIPKMLRQEHDIRDGEQFQVVVSFGDQRHEVKAKVTSGGEPYLPWAVASTICEAANPEGSNLIRFLLRHPDAFSIEDGRRRLAEDVAQSLASDAGERRARPDKAPHRPVSREILTTYFLRNPDVIAEALIRADGRCGACNRAAPFRRKSDGTPFLEVHHVIPLSEGGDDALDNVIALCPNCHRETHHGLPS